MTTQEVEKIVDEMTPDELRQFAIVGFMVSFNCISRLFKSFVPEKGSQGKS